MFLFPAFLQQKRNDREVEHLFASVQNTIDAKDSTIEKCYVLSETNLPLLKIKLDETSTLCENVLNRGVNQEAVSRRFHHLILFHCDEIPNEMRIVFLSVFLTQENRLKENRLAREKQWDRFVDDMKHKQSCVENTFEEKEEELREFYSDLERKLHIHK